MRSISVAVSVALPVFPPLLLLLPARLFDRFPFADIQVPYYVMILDGARVLATSLPLNVFVRLSANE